MTPEQVADHARLALYLDGMLTTSSPEQRRHRKLALALVAAGLAAVRLVEAERAYGQRRHLLEAATEAFNDHTKRANEALAIIEDPRT